MLSLQNKSNVLEYQIETAILVIMNGHRLAQIDKVAYSRLFRACSCYPSCLKGVYSGEMLQDMIEAELKNIIFDYHMRHRAPR